MAMMLTPSEVLEYVYCPRFIWFMRVQNVPQHEDRRYKVLKGREVHARRERENRGYHRIKLGEKRKEVAVYLASERLRLRGVVDEVLWLADGTIAPLDYKFSKKPDFSDGYSPHRVQITLYSMLVQEVYQQSVTKGFIAYIRQGSQVVTIEQNEQRFGEVQRIIDDIFAIIATNRLPPRTKQRVKCRDCCYKNICV